MTEHEDLQRTLTNALNELGLIVKKMRKNVTLIERYSSMSDSSEPYFSTEGEQRKRIKSLMQAQWDHMMRYFLLKRRIELTNLETQAEHCNKKCFVSDLIQVTQQSKREEERLKLEKIKGVINLYRQSIIAMSDKTGKQEVSEGGKLLRFYDEDDKERYWNKIEEFVNSAKNELDVRNVITILLNSPNQM